MTARKAPKTSSKRPSASSKDALLRMTRQRRRDTAPELALRSELHRLGHRFRVDYPLPAMRRRADVAYPRLRVAVFVDGCFWHGCPTHGTAPRANAEWWREKIAANVKRDRDTDRRLRDDGWAVVRIWEHQELDDATRSVQAVVDSARLRSSD